MRFGVVVQRVVAAAVRPYIIVQEMTGRERWIIVQCKIASQHCHWISINIIDNACIRDGGTCCQSIFINLKHFFLAGVCRNVDVFVFFSQHVGNIHSLLHNFTYNNYHQFSLFLCTTSRSKKQVRFFVLESLKKVYRKKCSIATFFFKISTSVNSDKISRTDFGYLFPIGYFFPHRISEKYRNKKSLKSRKVSRISRLRDYTSFSTRNLFRTICPRSLLLIWNAN